MLKPLIDWLDHRTGVRAFVGAMLLEGIPGGAKWRYVWGSCLAFVFSIQLVTGILLMTAYSPSSSQAWSSVHFIQYQMDFGWLIRGLHHFGSHTMVMLIALHMLQVVIAGAHLPPREVNWWLGIGLLSVTLGLSLTGYLLPWDQKGYWATRVATNIASNIPVFGDDIKQLAVGGPDYGNHTLTRFYALHVSILPLGLIGLLVAHLVIFRRHGVTCAENVEGLVTKPEGEHGAEQFWPRQAFYDLVACLTVFGVMLSLVLYGFSHPIEAPVEEGAEPPGLYEHWAKAGQRGKGAELDAAADRDTANYPARPEWYFLFLFQLLKYFPGDKILIGTVFIPNGVMLLLTLLPLFGYGRMRIVGHFLGMLVMMSLLILVGMLTLFALRDDSPDGILWGLLKNTNEADIEKAKSFQHSVHDAEEKAQRACQMAMAGSPVEGGHMLIRNDPLTTGRHLFEKHCGSCHAFTASQDDKFRRFLIIDGKFEQAFPGNLPGIRDALKEKGIKLAPKFQVKEIEPGQWQIDDEENDRVFKVARKKGDLELSTRSLTDGRSAGDLGDWGREPWIRSLLTDPMRSKHFGLVNTVEKDADSKPILDEKGKEKIIPGLTGMRGWRKGINKAREKKKIDPVQQDKDFDLIAKWLAYQAMPKDKRKDKQLLTSGQEAFINENNKCADCHTFEKWENGKWMVDGAPVGPDLTDYGSADWLRMMLMRPADKKRFSERNLMPAFRNLDVPDAEIRMQEFREGHKSENNSVLNLSDIERELIIRWMLRDYRPVYGGAAIK